ncbi:AfsR/SARP family transcriptional regulator [Micromonospora sp. CPCC 206061]|uniref:AfsR/SARP family transcriptional regulator n=1 Tax=Micromonospora sp. CPCC 206061 TaxID=3122410 RepID=UPI002FF1179E
MGLQFQVLGPVRLGVTGHGEHRVAVGPRKPRAMLATLLLSANERVSLDRLVGELWDRPPRSAVANLRTYASGLRRVLGEVDAGDRLVASPSGYLLRVEPHELDLRRFQTVTEAGRSALVRDDYPAAASRFREALDLWQGAPVEDVDPGPDLAIRIALLEEQHLAAIEDLVEARLAVGEHAAVTADLRLLVATHPFRERLHRQLMLALYRSGDAPAALAAYTRARAVLAEQLGIEPGVELAALHQAILRRAPDLSPPGEPEPPVVAGVPARASEPPRQLPPDPVTFVGRARELAVLRTACATADRPSVVVVHGPSGIGKTALVIRAGHLLASRYPDGQLHLDLRGDGAGAPGVDPAHALGRLLRGLGVPPGGVPDDPAEAAAMFRSQTAARRLLIVLDGAAGVDQVRPLLPAGPGCAVLITSNRPMCALDSTRLRLERLGVADGMRLLGLVAGDERVAADPPMAQRLVALCDGNPLALRIAGARLAARGDWTLADLAARLADERDRLDELRADDLALRSSFWASYGELAGSPDPDDRAAATALRTVAVLRVPEFPGAQAAAMIGTSERRAVALLDRLTEANLLEAVTPTTFHVPDLLRLFLADLAQTGA